MDFGIFYHDEHLAVRMYVHVNWELLLLHPYNGLFPGQPG